MIEEKMLYLSLCAFAINFTKDKLIYYLPYVIKLLGGRR